MKNFFRREEISEIIPPYAKDYLKFNIKDLKRKEGFKTEDFVRIDPFIETRIIEEYGLPILTDLRDRYGNILTPWLYFGLDEYGKDYDFRRNINKLISSNISVNGTRNKQNENLHGFYLAGLGLYYGDYVNKNFDLKSNLNDLYIEDYINKDWKFSTYLSYGEIISPTKMEIILDPNIKEVSQKLPGIIKFNYSHYDKNSGNNYTFSIKPVFPKLHYNNVGIEDYLVEFSLNTPNSDFILNITLPTKEISFKKDLIHKHNNNTSFNLNEMNKLLRNIESFSNEKLFYSKLDVNNSVKNIVENLSTNSSKDIFSLLKFTDRIINF